MLRSLFVLLILVPGLVAALGNRFIALLLYLWFALFRPQDWLWIDITALRLSLVIGLVLLVPALATGLFPNLTHPLSVGMALFICSALLSQLGAVSPELGWPWVDFTVRLLLVCMLLVTLVRSPRRLVMVLGVISCSFGFHAAKAGLAWLLGGGQMRFADGLSGAFVDNNGYALGTVMTIPLLLATAQNVSVVYDGPKAPWVKRGLYVAAFFCVFTVVGTYSRGGFVALSAVILAYVAMQRRRVAALTTLLSLATILWLVVPIPQGYVDRLLTLRDYDDTDEESVVGRQHFWNVGIRMGMAQPFGVGIRQYEVAYDRYDFSDGEYGRGRAVHNSHVQVFAELGFPGAAVWTSMFAYAFVACLRVRARSQTETLSPQSRQLFLTAANGLLASMVGFVTGGTFLSAALNDLTWLTFAMIAALDRVSAEICVQPSHAPAIRPEARPALALRGVDSFATMKEKTDMRSAARTRRLGGGA